jgi:MinD superfamily P-loop ATPase
VNNCEDEITFLCNCCPCCCPILGALSKGLTNVGQPSRFITLFDQDLCQTCGTCIDYCHINALSLEDEGILFNAESCIGCGLCASHCPHGAIEMILRDNPHEIYETSQKLDAKIQREAIIGKLKSWIFGS